MTYSQHLDISLRSRHTKDFSVDLVKLALAALLRAFIAKQGPAREHLEGGMVIKSVGDEGAANSSRELRTQRYLFLAGAV